VQFAIRNAPDRTGTPRAKKERKKNDAPADPQSEVGKADQEHIASARTDAL
jgi:hypothetical protein